jgi:hypothetical protein
LADKERDRLRNAAGCVSRHAPASIPIRVIVTLHSIHRHWVFSSAGCYCPISISAVCIYIALLPQTRQDREAFVVRLLSLYVANNKNGYDGSVGVLPFASKAFFGGNSYTFKRKKEKKKLIFFCAGQWL